MLQTYRVKNISFGAKLAVHDKANQALCEG